MWHILFTLIDNWVTDRYNLDLNVSESDFCWSMLSFCAGRKNDWQRWWILYLSDRWCVGPYVIQVTVQLSIESHDLFAWRTVKQCWNWIVIFSLFIRVYLTTSKHCQCTVHFKEWIKPAPVSAYYMWLKWGKHWLESCQRAWDRYWGLNTWPSHHQSSIQTIWLWHS